MCALCLLSYERMLLCVDSICRVILGQFFCHIASKSMLGFLGNSNLGNCHPLSFYSYVWNIDSQLHAVGANLICFVPFGTPAYVVLHCVTELFLVDCLQ